MSFQSLRRVVQGEIFDYQMLKHHLREYKKPGDAISRWLDNGLIVRIKKGLFIFGPDHQKQGVSREILANLIYSPSYVSFEYALSKYGLIPERAYEVTSVCLHRSKTFKTAVGMFSYKKRLLEVYSVGTTQEDGYLIATPEKALVDLISREKRLKSVQDLKEFLYENMRMEQTDLQKMTRRLLVQILKAYDMSQQLIRAIYD